MHNMKILATTIFCAFYISLCAQYNIMTYNPTNLNSSMKIVQIDFVPTSTLVYLKYTNKLVDGAWANIGEDTYLYDRLSRKKYKMLNSYNLPINSGGVNRFARFDRTGDELYCCLEFEKIPDELNQFDMIENLNSATAFNFNEIKIDKGKTNKLLNIGDWIGDNQCIEYGKYMDKGTLVNYCKHNGLSISLVVNAIKEYGTYFQINLNIQNFTGKDILFNPLAIKSTTTKVNKNKIEDLVILSYNDYMNKVKRSQTWSMIGVSLSQGLATYGAGYSSSSTTNSGSTVTNSYGSIHGNVGNTYGSVYGGTSSYSTSYGRSVTNSYNGAAAYAAQQNAQNNMSKYSQQQYEIKKRIADGYAQTNTLFNQTEYSTYFNVKYEKIQNIQIYITINGQTYVFYN